MSVFSFLLVSISSPRISFFCIYILFQHSSVDISISSQWNRYQREPKQDEFLWLVCYCLFAICCRWKQVRAFHRVVSNETLLHPCCWFYECVCARARVCVCVWVRWMWMFLSQYPAIPWRRRYATEKKTQRRQLFTSMLCTYSNNANSSCLVCS